MGVNLRDLIERKEISINDLSDKKLAVDSYNILHQFLSTIRQRDGTPLMDSKGRITSHLIGLFSRTTHLMQKNVKLIFVFDGEMPKLKRSEIAKREMIKKEAAIKYKEAVKKKDVVEMQKYAARTSRLTPEMVDQAKRMLELLGLPVIQAPSEAEAQASYLVKRGDAWAVASQDYDSLLYGAKKLIQNLSILGRRKKAGVLATQIVKPSIIDLSANLKKLGISNDQLIRLAMLVGTDYNPGGVKGIGPRNALRLVKEHKSIKELFEKVKWEEYSAVSWKEVYDLFKKMPVTEKYEIKFNAIKQKELIDFLVGEHDFGKERVEKTVSLLQKKSQQPLGNWLKK